MATMTQIVEGMTILQKYDQEDESCAAEHDIVYAGGVPAEKMEKADVEKLDELGWHWDGEYDCWARFT